MNIGSDVRSSPSIPESLYIGPVLDDEEITEVERVLRSGRITQLSSDEVERFEKSFASYVGAKEAIAVNSGTAAIHTALASYDIGPGDEVIVPAFTFIGTVGPVLQQGATPVFADIDLDTFCLSPEDIDRKITTRTKAIIPVDLFGHPADLDAIRKLADEHDLLVIEDACQSHGAEYKGRKLGSISHATCFSFQESKNMTTGEGGMITTDDTDFASVCRRVRHQGERSWHVIERLGWNYRMTALQAAIGIVQLRRLEKFNEARRRNAAIYTEELWGLDLRLPSEKPYAESVYHVYTFILPAGMAPKRDEIVEALTRERVPAMVAYPSPLYSSPLFSKYSGPHNCPVTEDVSRRVITLATSQSIMPEIAREIAKTTRKVLEMYGVGSSAE